MDVRVKFLGGTGTVTGSRFLLDIGDFRLLFDCGLFQGLKELRLRNWEVFPVDASSIHAVIISHAHIDHTGYLPKLIKEGFKGPIYCTRPTADLMELMLLDSAKLQEEEASYAYAHKYSKHAVPLPLYTSEDAQNVLPLIKDFHFDEVIKISERIEIIFKDAGHLLGAAITELFIKGDNQKKKIVFSGDLGRSNDFMLRPPAVIDEADILFVESTYGHKDNPGGDPATELTRIVNDTFKNNGVLLIPAFAVGRTQLLLYHLHMLMEEDRIPDVPVYIDSPMATSATYLYYKFPKYHKVKFNQSQFARQLETNMLVFVKNSKHSKALNEIKSRAIIISSSGMMTGGRILHHMYHRLPNKQDTLLISGYQAAGTRGRRLVDKEPTIRIFGEEVAVNCKVENMSSFSGHADREELFGWLKNFKNPPKVTFTVHGENPGLSIYAQAIRDRMKWNVVVPEYLESMQLFQGI
ncbi:MBL fold metallo-hydrolase [Chryseolinea sp. H1M3-3]|uniref:MBL fold metallo-hydrolase n=1 Tax=Chryseolinea sp. H1M3-3 TaxID=3034144 RepID=UPI0023ED34B2|nr:MBL fold metallo-hydrolase [Chryseolinea sp. H1M3-3]